MADHKFNDFSAASEFVIDNMRSCNFISQNKGCWRPAEWFNGMCDMERSSWPIHFKFSAYQQGKFSFGFIELSQFSTSLMWPTTSSCFALSFANVITVVVVVIVVNFIGKIYSLSIDQIKSKKKFCDRK